MKSIILVYFRLNFRPIFTRRPDTDKQNDDFVFKNDEFCIQNDDLNANVPTLVELQPLVDQDTQALSFEFTVYNGERVREPRPVEVISQLLAFR